MKIKHFNFPLIAQVLVAMLFGVLTGWFMPSWFVRIFVTFSDFFGQFIGFLVPLIVLALVAAAIINTQQNAGKLLSITLIIVFTSTILSGLFSYGIGEISLYHFIQIDPQIALEPEISGQFSPFFTLQLPPPLDVMTALVLALMIGLGVKSANATGLKKAICELQDVVMISIEKALVPLLPLYIYSIFLHMAAAGNVMKLLTNFVVVILLIIATHIVWILLLYFIAGSMTRQNPFKLLWQMMPAGIFAFATSSSAATIPITLKQSKQIVKNENTVSFVIPLCANLHIPGVSIHVVLCAMSLMIFFSQPIELLTFITFILMLSVTCVAAPGVPGGTVAVLPVLATVLNFSPEMQALCLSLSIALDAHLTAVNVLCDGAVCVMVDKLTTSKTAIK